MVAVDELYVFEGVDFVDEGVFLPADVGHVAPVVGAVGYAWGVCGGVEDEVVGSGGG